MSASTRITHIALKLDDIERASKFWQEVFGFKLTASYYQRDHLSVHLTDGAIDLALVHFGDAHTDAAKAAGEGPASITSASTCRRTRWSAIALNCAMRAASSSAIPARGR